jgi:hypothetical protein
LQSFHKQTFSHKAKGDIKMKVYFDCFYVLCFLLLVFCVGCDSGDSNTDEGNFSSISVGANPAVSDCDRVDTGLIKSFSQEEETESCRDERLLWHYDEESQTVHFLNKNVWLNCCGVHSISIFWDKETGDFEIEETDDPINGGRCLCECFYDFEIDLIDSKTISDTIYVMLTRVIDGHEDKILEGDLVLSVGEGDELIEENVGDCLLTDN